MTILDSLILWTGVALAWWLLAVLIVLRSLVATPAPAPPDRRRITVFKALAPTAERQERHRLGACLASFAAELDDAAELLVGAPGTDAAYWRRWLQRIQPLYPHAVIKLVVDHAPHRYGANPKISWMRILAPHASGELWFWSDADMRAPAGTLRALRVDFGRGDAVLLTSPYVVRRVASAAELLDALYVNLEHYPGAVLLARLNRLRFAFGAGMLFEAAAFRRRVSWRYLAGCLADDFHLGRLMQPVRLGSVRLSTLPASRGWRGALAHYHRWQKTVRWCAPGAYAAQVLVLPALGWLCWLALHPAEATAWAGLAAVASVETMAAWSICALLGCRLSARHLPALPLWTLVRAATWLICWLPSPIRWRGTTWWSPWQSRAWRPNGT